MVFPNVIRTGVRVRAKAVARPRVLSGGAFWCALAVVSVVAYVAVCGYVYSLSRERHRLVVQRSELRREYFLLRSRCEALRNPLRIRQMVEAYGMERLTEPKAVRGPVVLAKRN